MDVSVDRAEGGNLAWEREIAKIKRKISGERRYQIDLSLLTHGIQIRDGRQSPEPEPERFFFLARKSRLSNHTTRLNLAATTTTFNSSVSLGTLLEG